MNVWILLGISIACELFGTTMLKYSDGFSKIAPTLAAVAAFSVSLYLVSRVFQTLPVGIVYAIWSGVGIIMTALIGLLVFGQKPDLAAMIGMAMIVGGVVVINLFSHTAH